MKAPDFKFRVTNTETGESIVMSLADLQGYEGEDCGVFIDKSAYEHLPEEHRKSWNQTKISNKSGYAPTDIDWNLLDFEFIPPTEKEKDGGWTKEELQEKSKEEIIEILLYYQATNSVLAEELQHLLERDSHFIPD